MISSRKKAGTWLYPLVTYFCASLHHPLGSDVTILWLFLHLLIIYHVLPASLMFFIVALSSKEMWWLPVSKSHPPTDVLQPGQCNNDKKCFPLALMRLFSNNNSMIHRYLVSILLAKSNRKLCCFYNTPFDAAQSAIRWLSLDIFLTLWDSKAETYIGNNTQEGTKGYNLRCVV